MEASQEMIYIVAHKAQIVYALIAIASGSLAAWLAITTRVKAAFASAAHARAAYKTVNTKYNEAIREISGLRRQLANLIEENEALSGRHTHKGHGDDDWESAQSMFDKAAEEFAKSEEANAVAVGVAQAPKVPKRDGLIEAANREAASLEITQALQLLDPEEHGKNKHGQFTFRPKPRQEGYRADNTRDSKDA
jgi:hypothetical protein